MYGNGTFLQLEEYSGGCRLVYKLSRRLSEMGPISYSSCTQHWGVSEKLDLSDALLLCCLL